MKRREIFNEAYDYLKKVGFLIPFDDKLELYHGRNRGRREVGEWKVNPRFKNAGNLTGNRNIYGISSLSTATKELAMDYAKKRAFSDGGTPEIHRIMTDDKNAMIINRNFFLDKKSKEERSKLLYYLTVLTNFNISELSPAKFSEKDDYVLAYKTLKANYNDMFLLTSEVEKIYNQLKLKSPSMSKNLVMQVAGALNAKQLLIHHPNTVIEKFVLEKNENFRKSFAVKDGDEIKSAPLNQEYISAWFAHNHIIGTQSVFQSGTLGKKMNAIYIFDLDKINTEKAVGEKLQQVMSEYGEITEFVDNFASEEIVQFLSKSSPSETIRFLGKTNEKYQKLLRADSGVHEGFSVQEHTEAVLKVFEDTFQRDVPPGLLPFMKLAFFAHDLGKGWAFKSHEDQKPYNDKVCKALTSDLKIEKKYSDIIRFVIGESQLFTTAYYVKKDLSALDKLRERCFAVLLQSYGKEPSANLVNGLVGICKMLQTCDSGAYTPQAVIRDSKSNLRYRGMNTRFQDSFQVPPDLQQRAQYLKDPRIQ